MTSSKPIGKEQFTLMRLLNWRKSADTRHKKSLSEMEIAPKKLDQKSNFWGSAQWRAFLHIPGFFQMLDSYVNRLEAGPAIADHKARMVTMKVQFIIAKGGETNWPVCC